MMMATFIIYIIRWAFCLMLLYSLFGLFMKHETLHGFNRVVLLVILIASMLLPVVQLQTREPNYVTQGREILESKILLEERIVRKNGDYWATDAEEEYKRNISRITNTPSTKIADIDLKEWSWGFTLLLILEIYVFGLIVAWLRYLWSLFMLARLICQGKRVDVKGLPKHVHVVTHPNIKNPCSWMRWILLNPADAELIYPLHHRKGPGEGLLLHELAHIRLGHSWDMLLCEFTCRMLWCVPFAWMLRQDLRDVHEYQADRRVLQNGINDEEYQLLLIKKASGTGLQPVVNALNQSPIKRRFKMMYRKPSQRWVALKAAYLLPLSALAVVVFARPQTLSEIEEKVEQGSGSAASLVEEVTKYVATATWGNDEPATAEPLELTVQPAIVEAKDTAQAMADANLVNADLANSALTESDLAESLHSVPGGFPAKTVPELLDSTMQAVGARKIAEGTYVGHFQPSLHSDTVRIARATILDRKSQLTGEHLFVQNATDPYTYNVTLNAETRKDCKGYYIRYLQPVNSKLRNYDKPDVDPLMLSTDSVLTKRSSSHIFTYMPAAIERNKKETRIYMYVGFRGQVPVDTWRQQNRNNYADFAIVDETTGDKYVCRATDYDYFKYVKEETFTYIKDGQSRKDTAQIYQTCLVFPPLGKNVKRAHFGSIEYDGPYSNTFDLNAIPRKGRVITK